MLTGLYPKRAGRRKSYANRYRQSYLESLRSRPPERESGKKEKQCMPFYLCEIRHDKGCGPVIDEIERTVVVVTNNRREAINLLEKKFPNASYSGVVETFSKQTKLFTVDGPYLQLGLDD